jgi:hypothetical protein
MASLPPVSTHQAYDLIIHSVIPLPDLPSPSGPSSAPGAPVVIRRAPVPRLPRPYDALGRCVCTHADGRMALFSWPERRCWFRVADGCEIVIDAEAHAGDATLRLFIMGIGLAAILHQRGRLVLQASAVLIRQRAIAFVGASGYGKATMAAALRARGHDTLAEEVIAIANDDRGRVTLAQGGADLRLWPGSAAWLGLDGEPPPCLQPDPGPHGPRPASRPPVAPRTLAAIIVLADGERLALTEPSPPQAFLDLVRSSFCGHMPACSGSVAHLQTCGEVIRRIPVRTLSRPFTFAHLAAAAAAIDAWVRDGLESPRPVPDQPPAADDRTIDLGTDRPAGHGAVAAVHLVP